MNHDHYNDRIIADQYRDIADHHHERADDRSYTKRTPEPVELPPADGMMHTMESSHWELNTGEIVPSRWLRRATIRNLSLWKNTFQTPQVDENKKRVFLFLPGFSSYTLRSNEYVSFLEFLVFDIDEGQSIAEATERLRRAGVDAVIYTSWSHKAAKHGDIAERFRVVIRLKNRFVMHDHATGSNTGQQVWSRFYTVAGDRLGLNYDRACSDPARLYCLPCHPLDREPDYQLIEFTGDPLCFDADVLQAKKQLASEHEERLRRASERENRRSELTPATLQVIEAALAHIPAGVSYPIWRDVVWSVHSEFAYTDEESNAFDLVEEWSAGCPDKFDPDVLTNLWEQADRDRGVTLGTLFYYAFSHGFDRDAYALTRLQQLISRRK